MANSVDPDQTSPIGTVCSGSTLFASILNSSVMQSNYLQQTTSADEIFRCIFILGALRVNSYMITDPILNNIGSAHTSSVQLICTEQKTPLSLFSLSLFKRGSMDQCRVRGGSN